jgi:hypothetical protein
LIHNSITSSWLFAWWEEREAKCSGGKQTLNSIVGARKGGSKFVITDIDVYS